PFFVDGSGYSTLIQVVNTSTVAGSVTLTAKTPNGTGIGNPVVLGLPAGGSIRKSVHNLFGLSSNMSSGWIGIQSATPTITSSAIGAPAGGFVVNPAGPAASTNFAFAVDPADSQFFNGLTIFNPSNTAATITIRDLLDNGTP